MKKYFDRPMQVKFWDEDNKDWFGGIGIEDTIICGCCGSTMSIEEICEDSSVINPIITLDWLNISNEIIDE